MANLGLLGSGGATFRQILDLRQQRQDIIAANVANVDTPGYKAKRMDFESALREAMPQAGELPMARTSQRHLPLPIQEGFDGQVDVVEIPIPKGDQNSVDLEQEMAALSANQLLYNYAAQALSGQLHKMRLVIDGGTGG